MITQLQGLTDIVTNMDDLYHPECCGLHDLADPTPGDEVMALLEKMFKRIYGTMGMPDTIDKGMVRFFAKELFAEVEKGYGTELVAIDYDTPDYLVLRNLEENVYQFSAAKNYQQLKATTRALVGENGKLRTWTEFKNAAYQINNEHVTSWLAAERELAIAGGQMSATWQRAQENKAVLPLLVFDAVMDNRTSPICTSLDGVVKPVDDPFWDMYYPPNHFRCRSDVRSLPGGRTTPTTDIVFPDKIPAMFKTNMAKSGLVFPNDHPYYTGMPPQVSEQATKLNNRG